MTSTVAAPQELDAAYRARRARLTATVSAAALATWNASDPTAAAQQVIPIVEAGQRHVVALVDAYMAAKSLQATGYGTVHGLDAALYTTAALRSGVTAAEVYARPAHALDQHGLSEQQATVSAVKLLDKIVRTDLQLAQTHAARDWMAGDERIVGWRRVLTGATSCPLCTAASTRTYRKSDLAPIHEHCDCIVAPLWGIEPVASVGTTVRVEQDPEIGPRLMADSWSPVGPRLVMEQPEHQPFE